MTKTCALVAATARMLARSAPLSSHKPVPLACAAKCTFCAGGPEKDGSQAEMVKYGRNRLSEGKLPACAEMCSTKALLGGDGDMVADIYRNRVLKRAKGEEVWGWGTAYGTGGKPPAQPAPVKKEGQS
jgi:formate dehydrogenase iron-sulfur subunit